MDNKGNKLGGVFLLCGLVLAGGACYCKASPPDGIGVKLLFSLGQKAPDDQPVTVSVSGRITDARTKKPIPHALVRGHIFTWRHSGPELFDKFPYAEVKADADGKYELQFVMLLATSGPVKGKNSICVYTGSPGYETRPLYVGPNVTAAKTNYTNVDIALGDGELISGKVVDEDNNPVEGAIVRVKNGSNADWEFFGALGQGHTDENGEFRIWSSRQVIGPRAWLRIIKPGYGVGFFWNISEKDSMGTLVLPRGGIVVGRVVDKAGRGVQGAEVCARNYRGLIDKTLTDKDGEYELRGIPARTALVRFSQRKSPKREPWTSVIVYARVEAGMNLRDAPQYAITGESGQTIRGPDLVVGTQTSVSGKLIPSKTTHGLNGLMVRLDYDWAYIVEADADGEFRFPNVPPGKHWLTAYLPHNLRGDCGVGRVEINVERYKPVENVGIQLDALAEVRVQILDAKGNPLEGITAGATWARSGNGFWTEGTKSDKNGWAVLFLYPGRVQYVRGFDPDRDLVAEGYEMVDPKPGQIIENLRVIMVPTARITGRLAVEGKETLTDRRILCRLKYADGIERKQLLNVDSSGRFEVDKLTPGVAQLSVETRPLELSGKIGTSIEIKPGEDKDVGQITLEKVKFSNVSSTLALSATFCASRKSNSGASKVD